jgi:acetyl-CoA synthetase
MAGLFDVLCPALFFGRPVLAYDGGQFDPAKAFELIDEYEVTFYFAPPTALRAMMHVPAEEFDVDNLRTIASGGESVGRRIVQWAEETFGGAALHEGYGQTEANYLLSECSTLDRSRDGSMGVPGPGHDVEVVDPETAEATVEPGEIGELAVRYEENPVCFEEYLNRPDATADKIRNGWLLTEDLAYKDEEGYLYFKSRKDDVIISAGYRIGPEEVEESLASHEAVADAGVVGVFDEERGEVPAAFVVLVDDHTPSEELASTLQRHVKERLAKYEYPREITFLEQLPRTTTGKVRRAALRERDGLEQG